MRIAFDLDDTLIPTTVAFACGARHMPWPLRIFYPEALRQGTAALLKELQHSHELWVYTTSLRSPWYVRSWFFLLGIRIACVVNQKDHAEAVKGHYRYSGFSKAPVLFGVDLMIDDAPGVEQECQQQDCRVLILSPDDKDWSDKIKRAVSG